MEVERASLSQTKHHHHHHHIHCLLQTQHQPQIFPCPIKLLFFSYSTRLTRISKLSFKVEGCFFSIALRLLLQKPKACDLLLKSKVKVGKHALKRSQKKTKEGENGESGSCLFADFSGVPYLGVGPVRQTYTCSCKMGTG